MYSIIRNIHKIFKTGMYDYCNLESNDSEKGVNTNFVNKDGGLSCVIRIDGTNEIMGKNKFKQLVNLLQQNMQGILKEPGYKMQFVFTRDPDNSIFEVKKSLNKIRKTADRVGLEFSAILDERESLLSKKTILEKCYLIITTLPTVLPKSYYDTALKNRGKAVEKYGILLKPGEFGLSPHTIIKEIRQKHNGFVQIVLNVLKSNTCAELLDVHDACRCIKQEISRGTVGENWKPSLLGDKISPRECKESLKKEDISHLLNPSIAFQLFNLIPKIDKDDGSLVRYGNQIIAPLMVDIPAQDAESFNNLFEKIDKAIPWRWSITIETGHNQVLSKIKTKNSFATFLSLFNSENKAIQDAAQEYFEYVRAGGTLLHCYMSFCTWGDTIEETNRRKQILLQSVSTWGNIEVIEELGDPIEPWLDTIPAFTKKPISKPFPLTMNDFFKSFPITRPASPWSYGSVLFRTIDEKIFPYEPGSSKQATWIDLIFAPPGMGKSLLLSAMNTALAVNSSNTKLPIISTIDIGYGGLAYIDFLKSSINRKDKDLIQGFRLQMTKDFCVNVFDTLLGCQYPTSHDRAFLVNFLSLILTPAGQSSISRLPEIISTLIDEMYEFFSEGKNPKTYTQHINKEVDSVLNLINYIHDCESDISWHQITKILFEKGYIKEALYAHRQAMPNLSDATSILTNSRNVKDLFIDAATDNGENTISLIKSMISSVIKDYVILGSSTVFDIGQARISCMDISGVVQGGSSASANKQLSTMYLLAMRIMTKSFIVHSEIIEEIPVVYRKYHKDIIDYNEDCPKKLCLDEFHTTRGASQVRLQCAEIGRIGRKNNIHIALLSQLVDDFDQEMIDIATNVFILSKGGSETVTKKIIDKFSPSEDAIRYLKAYCNGPSAEGSTMLWLGTLKGSGSFEAIVRLTLGTKERWAYSTTKEDSKLKIRLIKEIGVSKTLDLLSHAFPSGSAESYIKSRMEDLDVVDAQNDSIYDTIKKELIQSNQNLLN